MDTAKATILLSLVQAYSLKLNPLYLMLPATVSCSFAFMMPVATPPNAIVYSASGMRTIDMIKCGFFLNILYVFTNYLNLCLLGDAVFDVYNPEPEWVQKAAI